IRLPQVVGRPLVAITSLTAIGTPASGPSRSPRARAASTRSASASACSSATYRKAWTPSPTARPVSSRCPSTAAMRSRCARVTSTAETSPAARAAPSSAAVRRVRSLVMLSGTSVLLEDPRHAEALLGHLGGAGERLLRGQAGPRFVGPGDVGQRHRVGRRRHVVGGDLADGGHRVEDDVELAREPVELGGTQVDAGQGREVRDLVARDGGHEAPFQGPEATLESSRAYLAAAREFGACPRPRDWTGT